MFFELCSVHCLVHWLTRFSFRSLLRSFLYKPQLLFVNEFSHPARRLVLYNAAFFWLHCWSAGGSPGLEAALQGREPIICLSPPRRVLAKENDHVIDHATEAAIHDLVSLGNVEESWDLFNNMDEKREK
jgi:hypothetical protein